ncbi:MAG: hypothetical protein MUE97_02675 [Phycisphaerales bacterium]|nr:hypothetical protein [Phycisphaerales bacterium]
MSDQTNQQGTNAAEASDEARPALSSSPTFVPFAGGLVLGVIVGALGGAFFGPMVENKVKQPEPLRNPAATRATTVPAPADAEAIERAKLEAERRNASTPTEGAGSAKP